MNHRKKPFPDIIDPKTLEEALREIDRLNLKMYETNRARLQEFEINNMLKKTIAAMQKQIDKLKAKE